MNKISLNHILPKYFTPKTVENPSTIWQKKTSFQRSNFYLIIAPSGSGKSTLATAIFGNHFEYHGDIFFDETPLKSLPIEKIVSYRNDHIQLLFQDVRLISDLTIRENIELRLFGKTNSETTLKLETYSKTLGIDKILDQQAKNCSYGERQRAAIVRSLIKPAQFLIYDECFSHLDKNNKEVAFQLIQEVATKNGCALLFFELNDFPFFHNFEIVNL